MIRFAKGISIELCERRQPNDQPNDQTNDQTNDQPNDQQGTPSGVSCFFPSSRGVAEFVAHDGSILLLAATGHIRSFIAQRLGEGDEPSAKANLAPITAKVIAYPTGSAFESDWIVLERSRVMLPEQYAKINEQNRRSVLVLDRATGTWRIEDTLSLDTGPQERVIGPILSKKAARVLGETLDDVFELCRYPKELARAPNGCACVYKEMGRCPGVCDGSESMDGYRARFMLAIEAASTGIAWWGEQLRSEIHDASSAMDFERAQRTKHQLEAVDKLPIDALGLCRAMDRLGCVCITPSVRKGWAMVWVFGRDGLIPVVSLNDDSEHIEALVDRWQGQEPAAPIGFDRVWLDRFALLGRHWLARPAHARRRRVTILDLRDSCWRRKINQAISEASLPVELGQDDEEQTHIRG